MLFPCKLHSPWVDPFTVTNVFIHGTIEIKDEKTIIEFKVNLHILKPFYETFDKSHIHEIQFYEPTKMDH